MDNPSVERKPSLCNCRIKLIDRNSVMPGLPPLNALRAFEAAARHQGFIGASEELNVSRGAISRHVKILEEHLGVQLFVRNAQGVRLTEAGKHFQPILTDAFDQITSGANHVAKKSSELKIICPPGTSIRWLLPRLEEFRSQHPQIDLRLTTDFYGAAGFDPDEADLGFSVSNWPRRASNIKHLTLFPIHLTPVCTPEYSSSMGLTSPLDLGRCKLLSTKNNRSDWDEWVKTFMNKNLKLELDQEFPNIDMAIKASLMGLGVAMGDLVLCKDELASGTLVSPFPDMVLESPVGGICLIGAKEGWNEPKVEAFKSWAFASAELDRKLVCDLTGRAPL